jgi:hypothetical protein
VSCQKEVSLRYPQALDPQYPLETYWEVNYHRLKARGFLPFPEGDNKNVVQNFWPRSLQTFDTMLHYA